MVRPVRTFPVRARLPQGLEPLLDVARNLAWVWDRRSQDLFARIDPELWLRTRDPVRVLAASPDRLAVLESDQGFRDELAAVVEDLRHRMSDDLWFTSRDEAALRRVAYFSPEFGIAEALPQYSGGLGALAGDHLKAASDLGVPLAGVGLMYRHGYFRQVLDPEGWQQERYPVLDPVSLGLVPAAEEPIRVDLGAEPLLARVWRAQVGRVPLYLLDTDLEENQPELRDVTDRLYGGGQEHRIRQEILLGMGGIRALEALGEEPEVFHTNEGHAAFLCLERARRLVVDEGLSFDEAVEATRGSTVFTTHTSVPAGIDRFPRELMERYFTGYADDVGISFDRFMELGLEPGGTTDGPFNMAAMAFRLAAFANGVSELHGDVSRSLFAPLWPGVPADEVPIGSITNGVHARSWVHPEMDDLFSSRVGADWPVAEGGAWQGVEDIRDEELWRVRGQARAEMVGFVREHMRSAHLAKGSGDSDLWWVDELLDPGALTIGFARRFAGYKRATLLLSRPDRLRRLLNDPERPVQLVFAGKAHPADDHGKAMIQEIARFAWDPEVWRRIVFVEDYDIGVARALYQGCDVWLNTPRRPHEACGTSGMKAALNGSLNCSILDGWWDEMHDDSNGWAIPSAELYTDEARRDEAEAGGLFELLERRVVPLFFERDHDGIARGWTQLIRSSLTSLGPRITASRMVRDYTESLYEPAARRARVLNGDRAKSLAAWKARVAEAWDEVTISTVEASADTAEVGTEREVRAEVRLGRLTTDDVAVELVHGPLDVSESLAETSVVPMAPTGSSGGGPERYVGSFLCDRAGRYGFTVRVVPRHPDLVSPAELGRVLWA